MSDVISNANTRADNMLDLAKVHVETLQVISENDMLVGIAGAWEDATYAMQFEIEDLRADSNIYGVSPVGVNDPNGIKDLDEAKAVTIADPTDSEDYYTSALPSVWTAPVLPGFTQSAPTVDAPTLPEVGNFSAPDAYFVKGIEIPEWQTKDLPGEVEIFEPPVDAPNSLGISDLQLTVPEMNLVAPANSFSYEEQTYSSDLLGSIQALILSDTENGGYGIEPDDEAQLYARGREREARKAAAAITQVRKGIAARGFPVPPGSLYATERVILQENAVALSELNREIVLKRSELYVQARQFAVQQGLSLEQTLITYTGAKQERALKAAQASADFAIQYHNATVGLFNLRVVLSQLRIDIHKEQLTTAATRLQEYGQELAYADMSDKRNQVRLQKYNQQLDAVKVFYDAQAARESYLKLDIEIEQLEVAANKNQVDVYATQVRAATDEYELYSTAWKGEEIKQKVFTQQLAAYDQEVETEIKKAKIDQDIFNADIDLLKVQRERKLTALDQYKVKIDKLVNSSNAQRDMNREVLDQWRTNRATEQFNNSTALETQIARATKLLEAENTNITRSGQTVDALVKSKQARANAAQVALQLYRDGLKNELTSTTAIVTSTAT